MKQTSQTHSPSEFSTAKRTAMFRQVQRDAPSKARQFERVYTGKASPRLCIKVMCLQCCWMDEDAIRECSAPACPLWDFRPYQRKG